MPQYQVREKPDYHRMLDRLTISHDARDAAAMPRYPNCCEHHRAEAANAVCRAALQTPLVSTGPEGLDAEPQPTVDIDRPLAMQWPSIVAWCAMLGALAALLAAI